MAPQHTTKPTRRSQHPNVPYLQGSKPLPGFCLVNEAYTAIVRDKSGPTSDDGAPGRKIAFARLVAQALSRFQDQPVEGRRRRRRSQTDFANAVGVDRSTIDRWLYGRWENDPKPDKVDAFARVAGLDVTDVYAVLGWGHPTPQRLATPPIRNPRVVELERLLEDPHVPASYKTLVQTTLDLLLKNNPTDSDQ